MITRRLLAALLATSTLLTPVTLQAQAARPAAQQAVPLAQLIRGVDIPYQQFTLPNGLRVLVHEDRKAPVVAVSIWYHVGSKDEPQGQTGFAHLFEHMMFYGSENAPGDFFAKLSEIGATDWNGTTWYDRTNYFETVPTPALERALFLESDRMGYLLGAVTEAKLRNQIGVVQNEKRQNDNNPYGLVSYAQSAALFPEGHPYRHLTIGSMADLNGASLEQVKGWFRAKYGPNNAVLVLAGDVDLATARTLVTKYFGAIPRGPAVTPAAAAVPTLPAPVSESMRDRVATTRLYRSWVVPGRNDPERIPLAVGASVLGGLSSSRLDNILVRGERLAVGVTANVQTFERISTYDITADVRPGVDPQTVAKRLDEIVAEFIAKGPTADEVSRVAAGYVSSRVRGLESVGGFGGKAVALAEGALYANDPEQYKKDLAAYASATPESVRAATSKWLSRPVYALTVSPGERSPADEARAGNVAEGSAAAPEPAPVAAAATGPAAPAARPTPAVGTIQDLDFPDVRRTRLSNGMELVYAQRTAVPVTNVSFSFDAGNAADPKAKLGTQALMLSLLKEGAGGRSSIQIAEEQERLGSGIYTGASMDRTTVGLSALSANLTPSLDLLSDVLRRPDFVPAEVERLRAQQITGIRAEMSNPNGMALRQLAPLLYGTAHPYGVPFSGSGDPDAVATVTRDELVAFHQAWLRPDNGKVFVVSDLPIERIVAALNAEFADWRAPAGAKGVKRLDAPVPAPRPRVVLIDRPGSPQSVIYGGQITPVTGRDDIVDINAANDVIGGQVTSRLWMDLRETKGWAYGAFGQLVRVKGPAIYLVSAPVQTDRTGESIAAIQSNYRAFLGDRGTQASELTTVTTQSVRELPGSFETGGAVLGALQTNDLYGRPDNYYETLPARYRTLGAPALDRAIRNAVKLDSFTWIVVGDAAKVRPQLEKLGLPIEEIKAQPAG